VESIGPAAAQEFSLLAAENTSGDPAATRVRVTQLAVPGGTLEMSAAAVARPMRLKKQENLG
jgi:hypothetical protein